MGAESSTYNPSGVKFPNITFNLAEGEGDEQTQIPLLPGGRVKMQLYDCGGSVEVHLFALPCTRCIVYGLAPLVSHILYLRIAIM